MRKICGIYLIRNTVNGCLYVGQSSAIGNRWLHHKSCLRRGKHGNAYLQRSWDKYGEAAFEFSLLQKTERSVDALTQAEQAWIDTLKPEYNISPVAGSTLGVKHPPRPPGFSEKMRRKFLGRRHRPDTIEKLRRIAQESSYTHPPEVRARISKGLKAVPFVMTERRREKYRRQRGKCYPQAIEAMRQANLGVPLSEETKRKIGLANKGKRLGTKLSEETKRKIGDAHRGRKRPDVGDKLRGRKRPPHVVAALKAGNERRWAANVARIREAIAADPDASTTTIAKRIKADWATVKKYQMEYRKCQQCPTQNASGATGSDLPRTLEQS